MILLITHSSDFYTIDIVQQQLSDRQQQSFRLDTDLFGTDYQFSFAPDGRLSFIQRISDGEKLAVSDIKAVWYRKRWHLEQPAELDKGFIGVFQQEYSTYLDMLFAQLHHLPWINPIEAASKVNANKLAQLQMASSVGLTVPHTTMTNDREEVHSFFKKNNGAVIMKLHGSLAKNMDGHQAFFPTTRLSADHLGELDALKYCPMIFQQEIPRAYELRVIYADGDFFTGKINAVGQEEPGTTDWRTTSVQNTGWEKYDLPVQVCTKIASLMQQFGLLFGAIDIIRQPDGEYVFLEVNPQGEWGMLQRDLGYPIGQTIADKLINRMK